MINILKIGQQLKQLRKDNHMTLKQVAASTGLSVSFISDIERERTNPSLTTIDKLARCYGLFCNVQFEVGDSRGA